MIRKIIQIDEARCNGCGACAAACRRCAEECEQHASAHDHCRICAEACHRCAAACDALLLTIGS